jgi:hypothetical protein
MIDVDKKLKPEVIEKCGLPLIDTNPISPNGNIVFPLARFFTIDFKFYLLNGKNDCLFRWSEKEDREEQKHHEFSSTGKSQTYRRAFSKTIQKFGLQNLSVFLGIFPC